MSGEANADHLFEAILALPRQDRLRLVERVIHELAEVEASSPSTSGAVVGLFADDIELMDSVVEAALNARERDPLRRPSDA